MNRFSCPTLILAGVIWLVGCGDRAETSTPSSSANAGNAQFVEGTHYHRLDKALDAPANEVVEVFSYACPACAATQPLVDAFKREQGDAVRLRYVPAEFQPHWPVFARAFHTASEMGALGRLHRAFYNAIYERRLPVNNLQDLAGIAASAGIDMNQFIQIARSPAVETALATGRDYVAAAGVSATPSFIVSGRYRVEARQPADTTALEVVEWLLKEQP